MILKFVLYFFTTLKMDMAVNYIIYNIIRKSDVGKKNHNSAVKYNIHKLLFSIKHKICCFIRYCKLYDI